MKVLFLRSRQVWLERGLVFCLLLSVASTIGWTMEKHHESNRRQRHAAQAQNYKNMVETILPPLIRQEQKPALYGRANWLDLAIKRFVTNLVYFQDYVTVVVVDPLSGDAVSNFSDNYRISKTEGKNYLQANSALIPLSVEVVIDDDTGQSELVGQIFIVENPYRTSQSNLVAISSVVFLGLNFVYLLFKKVERDKENLHLRAKEAKRDQENKYLKAKLELTQAQAENDALTKTVKEQENEHLKAQLKLMRVHAMNDAIRHIISTEFSSPLSNRLQELEALIENTLCRIQTATQDIIHDLRKAPLLSHEEAISLAFADVEKLDTSQQSQAFNEVKDYLIKAKDTIATANWVVDNLQDLTSLESSKVCLQKEICNLLNHLPPVLKKLAVDFDDNSSPLWISCNAIHLKSIVKNILYNSSAAIKKYNRELRKQRMPQIQGRITVRCLQGNQLASVTIEDNGPGIPDELLNKLYQVPQRLNQSRGSMKGNGNLIVYAYTRLHGGTIKVENRTEGGAKITVSFPLGTAGVPSIKAS